MANKSLVFLALVATVLSAPLPVVQRLNQDAGTPKCHDVLDDLQAFQCDADRQYTINLLHYSDDGKDWTYQLTALNADRPSKIFFQVPACASSGLDCQSGSVVLSTTWGDSTYGRFSTSVNGVISYFMTFSVPESWTTAGSSGNFTISYPVGMGMGTLSFGVECSTPACIAKRTFGSGGKSNGGGYGGNGGYGGGNGGYGGKGGDNGGKSDEDCEDDNNGGNNGGYGGGKDNDHNGGYGGKDNDGGYGGKNNDGGYGGKNHGGKDNDGGYGGKDEDCEDDNNNGGGGYGGKGHDNDDDDHHGGYGGKGHDNDNDDDDDDHHGGYGGKGHDNDDDDDHHGGYGGKGHDNGGKDEDCDDDNSSAPSSSSSSSGSAGGSDNGSDLGSDVDDDDECDCVFQQMVFIQVVGASCEVGVGECVNPRNPSPTGPVGIDGSNPNEGSYSYF